jgi:hypothetical protein
MTEMTDRFTPDATTDSGPRINGVLDVPRANRVAGWAIDRADPAAAVTVTILREGRLVGEVRADAHRPDLERGGIGTGRYGFAVDLDPPLEPGFEFTVTAIARADDGTSGEIRAVGRARPSDDAARRLAERTFAELTQLRVAVQAVAGRQDRDVDPRLVEALERVEVTQARLEQAIATTEPQPRRTSSRGLAVAVGVALATGIGSLGLGIWSMLVG